MSDPTSDQSHLQPSGVPISGSTVSKPHMFICKDGFVTDPTHLEMFFELAFCDLFPVSTGGTHDS